MYIDFVEKDLTFLLSAAHVEDSNRSNNVSDYEKMDALAKIEDLQVKFFRLLQRLAVGKSATINSIFDQGKAMTDAFEPATNRIQEIVGNVYGVRVTFIDTPGFLPSSTNNMRRNRKIMLSVKRFIGKSPPDIVLFFEWLDLLNMGYNDFPLMKLVFHVFGSAIWFKPILVMTHASLTLPEGPCGFPVNYESYVERFDGTLYTPGTIRHKTGKPNADEEDEYQLPPIRILTKSQIERLTKSQKRDYLDELDRETLYLKKQLKEDAQRQREKKLSEAETLVEDNNYDDQQQPSGGCPLTGYGSSSDF
ncbi:hypothetical protein GH714_041459 [Hevea brasiliensis]|uniref:AIG1-type G domain-containing protein n=1 Tax=Hevea brasiliensis TaxID=3981 RepID=A0A6A6N0Z7_HEVBR|nr:hypothetical protein GH714_041459 [Hevea brasiliensis]